MERLLCIVSRMDAGGAETFLMKVYRSLDRNLYQIDFCVSKKEKNFYEDEIIKLGGKMHRVSPKSKNFFSNFFGIRKIARDNQYKYVLRLSKHSLSSFELLAAKMGGAKIIAYRATNSSGRGAISNILHYIFRPLLNMVTNVKISPSTEAAEYVFGKKIVKDKKYFLLKNGLDIDKYGFSKVNREKIRKELKIENKFVIGHVGRFSKQKNHKFLLEIYKEYFVKNPNSVLLLIGEGELENEIKTYAKELNIFDNIIFYGITDKVNEFYSAMDFYIFPSFFEGMPNTVIEAQTSGLQCLISDSITKEAKITDKIKFKSLNDSSNSWSNEIVSSENRENAKKFLYSEGYDINSVAREFINIIFNNEKI